MKRSLLTLFAAAVCIIACSSVDPDVRAVSALAKRVLAHSSGKLEFQKTDAPTDSYRIEAHGRKVRISGNNANSMAVGLNTYLREYCHIEIGCVLHQRPSPSLNTRWSHPPYDPARLETVLDLLDQVDADTPALHFDRVNLRRQVLCNRAAVLYDRWKEAYDKKDLSGRKRLQAEFLSLMDELDKTLQAEPFFRLDKWIEDARSWGKDAAEKDYYEQNARNILTSWGGRGSRLTDYAARSISGLVNTYYKVRWQLFFEEIDRCESQGVPYGEKAFTEKLKDFEYQWWRVNR